MVEWPKDLQPWTGDSSDNHEWCFFCDEEKPNHKEDCFYVKIRAIESQHNGDDYVGKCPECKCNPSGSGEEFCTGDCYKQSPIESQPKGLLEPLDYVEVITWANNNGHLQYDKWLRPIIRDLCSQFGTTSQRRKLPSVEEIINLIYKTNRNKNIKYLSVCDCREIGRALYEILK